MKKTKKSKLEKKSLSKTNSIRKYKKNLKKNFIFYFFIFRNIFILFLF